MDMRGDGRVFLRGRIWWLAYYGPTPKGWRQIRESAHTDDEGAARKLLRKRVREAANHHDGIRVFDSAKRLTVGDLLTSLEANYRERGVKSLRKTLNHMTPVREFFGLQRAAHLTPDAIREYKAERKDAGASNATINRGLEILSAAYGLALKERRLAQKPYIEFLSEKGNERQGFFEADELARILPHLRAPLDDITRFAYRCGWRKDECRTLRWDMVDRADKRIALRDSKNGQPRALPLDDELWAMFERLWTARRFTTRHGEALSEYVFHVKGKPIGYTRFTQMWNEARKAAGLPHKLFHDLRRTAARNLIRAGVAQSDAKKITGHESDSMFQRYNITTTEDIREALKKQRAYLDAHPSETNVSPLRSGNEATTGTK